MTRKPLAPKPAPSRGRGLLGLAEDAHALLDAWRTQAPPGIGGDTRAVVRTLAAEVARELDAPAEVYVLDVCEADGALHLLELNPFGGASPEKLTLVPATWNSGMTIITVSSSS